MTFELGYYGDDCDYTPTRTASRADPNETFKHNILKQRDLFLGKEVLTTAGGKPLVPTFTEISPGVMRYGLKFGGQFVKLDGEKTHKKWPKNTFADYLMWLSELAGDGEFEIQLNGISAAISKRFEEAKRKRDERKRNAEATGNA